MKMYLAEVLSKFPVVQHFLFGSILVWEPNLNSDTIAETVHLSSQPKKDKSISYPETGSTQRYKTNLGAVTVSQDKSAVNENIPQIAKIVQPVCSSQLSNKALTRAPWARSTDQTALPVQSNSTAYITSAHKLRNPGTKE